MTIDLFQIDPFKGVKFVTDSLKTAVHDTKSQGFKTKSHPLLPFLHFHLFSKLKLFLKMKVANQSLKVSILLFHNFEWTFYR